MPGTDERIAALADEYNLDAEALRDALAVNVDRLMLSIMNERRRRIAREIVDAYVTGAEPGESAFSKMTREDLLRRKEQINQALSMGQDEPEPGESQS